MLKKTLLTVLTFVSLITSAQKVSLYKQFYGSFDYTMMGNTMNVNPNGDPYSCEILTSSSATLNIREDQEVVAAYLYWSGNGTEKEADLNVLLNNTQVQSQRTSYMYLDVDKQFAYFSAFSDVTQIIQKDRSGEYTLSDLDLTNHIERYCGGNYVGWAVVVVYKDHAIKDNLVGIYDGFESLDENNPAINILLDGFRITNTANSKIAFLAWEGDANLSLGEELKINDLVVSNALNPPNNAFNGTNTFSGSTEMWNMDLDQYDLSNFVNVDDTSLDIKITTAADVVFINTIVLSVYSVFPDATLLINNFKNYCNTRIIDLDFTVANHAGNHPLKKHTPIAFYIENELVAVSETSEEIGIGQEANYNIRINVPQKYPYRFELVGVVDDDGTGEGSVYEIDEENNSFNLPIDLTLNCPIQKGLSGNSDGMNDSFDLSIYGPNELKIYNRYGQQVFAYGKGYTNQWRGFDNQGRELPTGTYFYMFSTNFEVITGYIYMIREIK